MKCERSGVQAFRRSGVRLSLCLLLFLVLPCAVRAQNGTDKSAKAAADKDYLLGIDDVIEVTVTNHDDMDRTLTILPNGKINFAGVGEITAAGRTSRAVAEEIRAELDKTLNNFEVVVSVKEVRSRRVRAIGAVRAPGSYDMKPAWRVVDLLAVAGGPTAK